MGILSHYSPNLSYYSPLYLILLYQIQGPTMTVVLFTVLFMMFVCCVFAPRTLNIYDQDLARRRDDCVKLQQMLQNITHEIEFHPTPQKFHELNVLLTEMNRLGC